MIYKSYEYFTKDGIKKTDWFIWGNYDCPKWQLNKKLRNFYKTEPD